MRSVARCRPRVVPCELICRDLRCVAGRCYDDDGLSGGAGVIDMLRVLETLHNLAALVRFVHGSNPGCPVAFCFVFEPGCAFSASCLAERAGSIRLGHILPHSACPSLIASVSSGRLRAARERERAQDRDLGHEGRRRHVAGWLIGSESLRLVRDFLVGRYVRIAPLFVLCAWPVIPLCLLAGLIHSSAGCHLHGCKAHHCSRGVVEPSAGAPGAAAQHQTVAGEPLLG